MASGSLSSKAYDPALDDILFTNKFSSNGTHSDPSSKDFQKSRVFPASNAYTQPEETLNQELISTVEKTMKKYADNLMRFLEGISSRLSQLELYCYNLDKSIGETRSDLAHDNGEADSKLKFLEKHLQQVHRSVQILRDKQELAETQKELAKLQLAKKESSSPALDDKSTASASDLKKNEDVSDAPNTQLALALPSQIPQQLPHPAMQQQPAMPPQPSSQAPNQLQTYYMSSNKLIKSQAQPHSSYLAADAQYRVPELAPQAPPVPSQTQLNLIPQTQQLSQYQQQWLQQVTQPMQQPVQLPQQPLMQPQNQIRASSPQPNIYPPYMTSQPANGLNPEGISSSLAMQMPFHVISQAAASRPGEMPNGYCGSSRPVPPQPTPQHIKGSFPSPPGDNYASGGSHLPMSSAGSYMLYDGGGGRSHEFPQPTQYSQGGYLPSNPSLQNMPPPGNGSFMIRNLGSGPQQYVRNHPYNELMDKLVSMGYKGDHVVSVIQRLEESGQAVDFNAVLDRLNGHSSWSSQGIW